MDKKGGKRFRWCETPYAIRIRHRQIPPATFALLANSIEKVPHRLVTNVL
jgi:hypothetical protein